MAMAQKAVTVGKTDFPLYTIRMLGERYFLVAGGGGSAKTGIKNAIEIFELKDDRGKCVANKLNHFDVGDASIMNCCIMPRGSATMYTFAAGQDNKSQIYSIRQKIIKLKPMHAASDVDALEVSVRRRKGNLTNSKQYKEAIRAISFELELQRGVETDFSTGGAFQKCCAFSESKELLVTGGADGFIRTWQLPLLEKKKEVKAHSNEIDDLDVNPSGDAVCTISKDCKGTIWDIAKLNKTHDLLWNYNTSVKYRMRSCRYGIVEDKKDYRLYTTHIPVSRGTRPIHCYITKWSTTDYKPEKVQSTGKDVLSALAVSQNGDYLGVGTLTGNVSVYISFSLMKLYHVREAHGIFVTGLEFAPFTEAALEVTSDCDLTLFSISADNNIKIHQVPSRNMCNPLWAIFGFIILSYLAFWFISTI